MDWSIFLLLFGLFLFLLLLLQRIDPKRRLIVIVTLVPVVILTYNYINYRDAGAEGLLALLLASVIAFLFWLLIGRYNRVRSADETIQVLGLDD